MYSRLVIECGLPPAYVLDEMEPYEINAALEGLEYKYKEKWEQTRMICYVIAQSNSTKKIAPTDILKFPWDNKRETSEDIRIEQNDIERLKKKAEQYIKSK